MDKVLQTVEVAALLGTILCLHKLYAHQFEDEKTFSRLPVVGLEREWFPRIRATLRSVFKTQEWIFEGYNKVSHHVTIHSA